MECKRLSNEFASIRGLNVAAENGAYLAFNSTGTERLSFTSRLTQKDLTWKKAVQEVMQTYQEQTDGSYIISTDCSLVWNYSDVDSDFGTVQAKELMSNLVTMLEHSEVNIVADAGRIEVRPKEANKGQRLPNQGFF